jgi:TolB-like protein/Flp pilus assembly protein TadD
MVIAKLSVGGPFQVELPDGQCLAIRSRKAQALLAMLATSPTGERTRAWLQDHLWGSRAREQAQGSLRNELLLLNRQLAEAGLPQLKVTRNSIGIDLRYIALVDAPGVFLEGIDIAGEDSFEDWLRDMRSEDRLQLSNVLPTPGPAESLSPSIVVMPFANGTGDPALAYLAEGVADELLHRLSKLRWLTVITPGVQPATLEPAVQAGRRLGARYVLTGRLSRHDNDFRILTRLSDTRSGHMIWAQPFSMPAPQATGALDDIVDRMAALLDDRIDAAEQVRATSAPTELLAVHDLIWRGRWHQNRLTRADLMTAGNYFARATALAPSSSLAVVEQAQNLAYRVWIERQPEASFYEIRRLAEQAIRLDPEDARAHMMLGVAETWLRRSTLAEPMLNRAITLNPNLPVAHEQLATLFNLCGRPAEAIPPLRRSLTLSPADFRLFYKYSELALAHLFLGDFDAASTHATQAISLRRGYWHAHVVRINALARGGRLAEAKLALADLRDARPGFEASHIAWIPFTDPRNNGMLTEGLSLAEA